MSIHEPYFGEEPRLRTAGYPESAVTAEPIQIYRHGPKRLFDFCAVVMSAPFWMPIIALLALWIWVTEGNPFYRQSRVGKNGRIFQILKLRTMVRDADAQLEAYLRVNPAARVEWDLNQKLQCDPRITKVGQFLRKTSLDELPQLWNVLRGDMSLVGPRPMMPEQRAIYPGTAYFGMRPGMTGSWQISARNASTFADRARFDTSYAKDLTLINDLGILVATVNVVIKPTGF